MKWPWTVILAALALAGCRSSQPATNPFLRTTVPPPATGQGMMVMPGEPAPPVVTGVPGAAPVAPGTPVVPAQPAPMVAPPVTPQPEEPHPPGGSYLFHQSSHEPAQGDRAAGEVEGALASAPPRDLGAATGSSEVRPASYAAATIAVPAAGGEGSTLAFRSSAAAGANRGDPPQPMAAIAAGPQPPQENGLRIVGTSSGGSVAANAAPSATSGQSVFRLRAGPSSSASSPAGTPDAQGSRVAIVTPPDAANASTQLPTFVPSAR